MPQTLRAPAHSELLIKKSRFIGCVQPMADRASAQAVVDALWREHPGAAHVCGQLIDLVEAAINDLTHLLLITKICQNKIVCRRFVVPMCLEVHTTDPITFALEALDEVSADESTGTTNQCCFHEIFN